MTRVIENKNMEVPIDEKEKTKENVPSEEKEFDPFAAVDDFRSTGPSWSELDTTGKVKRVAVTVAKLILLLGLLYLFICSLSFLSSAFRLLGGKAAGEAFSSNTIIQNPIAGLMIGVVATVLLQSSSTTTSIVVAMVASGILEVSPAIPIIMGANIGTSVTNTIVAIGQIGDKNQFRRAFAGATVHDMFNMLAVVILLPLEVASHYLYHLTKEIINSMQFSSDKSMNKELLKKITKPFTNLVIQLDKKIIEKIAQGDQDAIDKSLVKYYCDKGMEMTTTKAVTKLVNVTSLDAKNTTQYVMQNVTTYVNETTKVYTKPCKFLFHDTGLSDTLIGVIMLLVALFILCVCLVLIVKTLHSLLRGQIAVVIRKTFNSDFPKPFGFLTGYVAILVGAGMTVLVQSSSIFTSAITPLVGLGVVSLERVFPLTLGSNIGTTATGLLAALASSGDRLGPALQIALCHLFFNISGIIVWYPVPFMRKIPVKMAKHLGNTTAEYRWFAVAYLIVVFFVIPASVFGLSLAGKAAFWSIMVPIIVLIAFVVVVNIIQDKKVEVLPEKLQDWKFLPKGCRSLEPYDKLITKVVSKIKRTSKTSDEKSNEVEMQRNDLNV